MSIQVKNISGLDSYGTSIHTFGGRFDEAASDTLREFNTSLEGEKAEAINALAKERNYDLSKSFAYSDSATDLPMLEAVGHAVAVNPDRALKKEALARGWDIRSFKNPEPLFQTRDMGIGAGVVAGIAAVTVGGWWLARRGKPGPA